MTSRVTLPWLTWKRFTHFVTSSAATPRTLRGSLNWTRTTTHTSSSTQSLYVTVWGGAQACSHPRQASFSPATPVPLLTDVPSDISKLISGSAQRADLNLRRSQVS